jgi:predicted adenine nucleotide alpha hydrolase (AANH) superfamily ATPase
VGFDLFATTLTLSPLKDASVINAVGAAAAAKYGAEYLPSDFKKRDGNRRSAELCKQFGLYRQNYCGCVFSK